MEEDGWVKFQFRILLLFSLAALTRALTEEQVPQICRGHFYIHKFLDAQASLAPTQVSLLVRWLVGNTFEFPFYQRV